MSRKTSTKKTPAPTAEKTAKTPKKSVAPKKSFAPKVSVAAKSAVPPKRSVVPKKSLAPKKSVAPKKSTAPRKTMLMKANELMKAELPTTCPDQPWTTIKKPALPVDVLPNLEGYARMSRLLSYDRLEKTLGVVLHKVFGQLLEKKLTDFQAAKKRIRNALNKDFGDSKKLGTPQRLKPMAALQEQIRHYKRMEVEFDEDETAVADQTVKTAKSGKKSLAKKKKSTIVLSDSSGEESEQQEEVLTDVSYSEGEESDDEEEEDEESDDEYDEDDIDGDVRSEALRRATACPRVLKEASLTKSNIRVPRKSSMHTIASKMKGLAIDETNDYDASGTVMDETTRLDDSEYTDSQAAPSFIRQTTGQSDDEGEMHETMVIMDEMDESEEAGMDQSECSPSFTYQATPYPKGSKPMSASSSFKGTPHPSNRVEKPSSVKSVRSVVSNKPSTAKPTRIRTGSRASYRSAGAESLINYDLADLSSGDETDNEECPKKPVPRWAQNSHVGPITVVLRNMVDEEQRERHFGRIELPARDSLFTYKDKASRKKTLKEAPLDWHSPLSNPRSANSRYLQMLEEVKARNAGSAALK